MAQNRASQGAAVYHKSLRAYRGPDISLRSDGFWRLISPASATEHIAKRMAAAAYRWRGAAGIWLRNQMGEDKQATREDIERTENNLRSSKEGAWIGRLSVPLREAVDPRRTVVEKGEGFAELCMGRPRRVVCHAG